MTKGSLQELFPEIASEWHPTYNQGAELTEISPGSKTKVWWLGKCGHEWEASIQQRTRKNTRCPICSGKKVLTGFNDLTTTHPELSKEWNPVKNRIPATSVSAGSPKTAWWACTEGHEWEAKISNRSKLKRGCPVCSNQLLVEGINDLYTTNPFLAAQWHPTKNHNSPKSVFAGSHEQAWWLGPCGHEWKAAIASRNRGNKCPYCSNQKTLRGSNDFAHTHPLLSKEWHPTKNTITPESITAGSDTVVYWLGECGHEWQSRIMHRALRSQNCPYCSGRRVLSGYNDLVTTHPSLLSEWNFEKNLKNPNELSRGSNYKAWWICRQNHQWQAVVKSRAISGLGCSQCSLAKTSKIEQAFRFHFSKVIESVNKDHNCKIELNGFSRKIQVDILGIHKGEKVVIEYDGSYYHHEEESISRDILITQSLLNTGYKVIRIREQPLIFLPQVESDNLLQLAYKWSLSPARIQEIIDKATAWLNT